MLGSNAKSGFIDQPEMAGISEYRQAIRLAEQWEPDELRGSRSRPALQASGGENPMADSPRHLRTEMKLQESSLENNFT